jgi:ribonucleoside-triphosphate reductase
MKPPKILSGNVLSEEKNCRFNVIKTLSKICTNYRLPYFTFSPTFSTCPSHGYISGEHFKCPKCGEECEVFSRVVGYIRPVRQWNEGKQSEFEIRKTYTMKEEVIFSNQ